MKHSVRIQFFFIFAEVDLDESNNVSLEEQVDLLDDYTPLDPAYLPAGLGEDDNKVRIFFNRDHSAQLDQMSKTRQN